MIAEVVGKRRRMRLATFSPILGVLSGDLEIIITDFRVSLNGQSLGEYRSYALQSSKAAYLSAFAENFFSLLGVSSANTSIPNFLLSLPTLCKKIGREGEGEGKWEGEEEGEGEGEGEGEDDDSDGVRGEERCVMETIGVESEEEEEVKEEDEATTVLEDELRDFSNLYGEFMVSEAK